MIRFVLTFALLSLMSLYFFPLYAQDKVKPENKTTDDSALQQMAKELGLPPLRKTEKSRSAVEDEIRDAVEKRVNEKVGFFDKEKFDKEKFKNEAQSKYSVWKVGDDVTVSDKRGRSFSGKIEEINRLCIVIDGKKLFTIDFTEEITLHVNAQKREEAISNYISMEKKKYERKYENDRNIAQNVIMSQLVRELYDKYGFVNIEGQWLSDTEYVEYLMSKMMFKNYDAYAAEQQKKGLVIYKAKWITIEEKEKLIAAEKTNEEVWKDRLERCENVKNKLLDYESYTDAQFKAYVREITSLYVFWTGNVLDVVENGDGCFCIAEMRGNSYKKLNVIFPIDENDISRLKKNDEISFQGNIGDITIRGNGVNVKLIGSRYRVKNN